MHEKYAEVKRARNSLLIENTELKAKVEQMEKFFVSVMNNLPVHRIAVLENKVKELETELKK